jgi:hypothetical protein
MHALAILAFALAQVPEPNPFPGTRDLGATSAPSGVLDWSRSWSADWTTGTSTPAPDVECESAGSGGDLTCSVAATKSGNPTTVGAPGWPARTAVLADGTNDYWTLGDTAPAGSFTACAVFRSDLISASTRQIVGKTNATKYSWRMYTYNDGVTAEVITPEDGSATSYVVTAGLSALAWNSYCFSYLYATSGTSTIRTNLNGVAGTPKTNAIGPCAAAPGVQLAIGADSAGGQDYTGGIALVSYYNGWAASAAELAALVASQQARLASKPLGAAVTVTSGETTCDSRGDGNLHSLPAGSLCCGAAGCEIWGAAQHSNGIPYSSDARSWSQRAGNPVTVTYGATGGPLGTGSSALVGVGAATVADIYLQAGGFTANGAVATGLYLKKTSASGTLTIASAEGVSKGRWYVDLAALGAGWELIKPGHAAVTVNTAFVASAAGYAGLQFVSATGTLDFEFSLATQQNGALLGPVAATAGTPLVGAPDVPTRPVADDVIDARGCAGARFTYPAVQEGNARVLGFGGAGTPLFLQLPTALAMYDGTAARTLTVPSMVGRQIEAATCWSGTTATIYDFTDNLSATVAYDGAFVHATRVLTIGSDAGNVSFLNSKVKTVCQGKDLAAIRACFRRHP